MPKKSNPIKNFANNFAKIDSEVQD